MVPAVALHAAGLAGAEIVVEELESPEMGIAIIIVKKNNKSTNDNTYY